MRPRRPSDAANAYKQVGRKQSGREGDNGVVHHTPYKGPEKNRRVQARDHALLHDLRGVQSVPRVQCPRRASICRTRRADARVHHSQPPHIIHLSITYLSPLVTRRRRVREKNSTPPFKCRCPTTRPHQRLKRSPRCRPSKQTQPPHMPDRSSNDGRTNARKMSWIVALSSTCGVKPSTVGSVPHRTWLRTTMTMIMASTIHDAPPSRRCSLWVLAR